MDDKPVSMRLRSIEDLTKAHEFVFNAQQNRKIYAKTADGLNTTLKGAVYLNGKLRIDAAKLVMQAKIKKIEFPDGLLPNLMTNSGRRSTRSEKWSGVRWCDGEM